MAQKAALTLEVTQGTWTQHQSHSRVVIIYEYLLYARHWTKSHTFAQFY